jgi:hypothetical protein
MSPRRRAETKGKSDSLVPGLRLKAMIQRKGTHKRKVTLARVRPLPLWLRRLDQVKAELKGARFPRTASGRVSPVHDALNDGSSLARRFPQGRSSQGK